MGFDGFAVLRGRRISLGEMVASALLLSLLLFGGANAAGAAQPEVDCSATSFVAGSEVEFNDALQCYNSATSAAGYVITLTATFESTTSWPTPTGTAAFVPITQSGAGFSMRIDGNHYFVNGSLGVTDVLLYLDGDAPITFNEVRFGNASFPVRYTTALLMARGDLTMVSSRVQTAGAVQGGALYVRGGTAAIFASTFDNGSVIPPYNIPVEGVLIEAGTISFVESGGNLVVFNGLVAVVNSNVAVRAIGGVVSVDHSRVSNLSVSGAATFVRNSSVGPTLLHEGLLVIENSLVKQSGDSTGISTRGGSLVLVESTVTGHEVNGIRVDGGDVMVLNSTLTGSLGKSAGTSGSIYITSGTVMVANSTIANDPYQGNDVDGINVAGGTVRAISSVVNGCSGNPVIDDGHNVGSCFGGADIELRALAGNGCAEGVGWYQPLSCVPSRALGEGSPALGAGTCTGVPVYDRATFTVAVGDLATDQRGLGFDRTPAGAPGCDAGALEGPLGGQQCAATEFIVATEQQFNDAIACYNAGSPRAGYRIVLDANIASTTTWTSGTTASFNPISGVADTWLEIDGQGYSLIGQPSPTEFGLVFGGSGAPIVLRNLTVSGSATALLVPTNALVIMSHSSLIGNQTGAAVLSGGDLHLIDSAVAGNAEVGVLSAGGRLTIVNSSIRDNGTRGVVAIDTEVVITESTLANNGGPGLLVQGSRPATVINSTVTGNAGAGVVVFEGAVSIASSTVAGNPAVDVAVADGAAATLVSSLVNLCAGVVADGGYNVGSCFGAAPVAPAPLAENGCAVPAGASPGAACTATMAIAAGSAAIGAGTCAGVPLYDGATGSVVTGNRILDQRGLFFPRTPGSAPGCDAGAFEAP